ncbi:copper chaperone PCu(A)C [Pontibacter sp. JAM-7]|uniref:copper chaperone PCu(A)C n=1 Tax=Pontibacter sp. JAM-7 TaxID=3366581 RepID=UPI003AF5146B
MVLRHHFIALSTALCLSLSCLLQASETIESNHAYARATPPGQTNSAAFVTLTNHTDTALQLTSAESTVTGSVELHEHQHDNGVMRMRQISAIDLPAGGQVSLQPGGYHIMLIGLQQPLIAGSEIGMTLHFSDGSVKNLVMPVQMPGTPQHKHAHH